MHRSPRPAGQRMVALLLAVTALAACDRVTAPDPAPEPGAPALNLGSPGPGGAHTVPFVIRSTTGVKPDSKRIPCGGLPGASVAAEYVGTGNATHLGRTSLTMTFDSCLLGQPLGGPVAFIVTADVTLMAANGDLLNGTVAYTQFTNGDFALDSFAFTGGTGRFANATGTLLAASGWVDPTTLQGYVELRGCITRPNA